MVIVFFIAIKKANAQREAREKAEKEAWEEQEEQAKKEKGKKWYQMKLQNIAKGLSYEKQIGQLCEQEGYKVEYRGIERGRKDDGIDIIAQDDQEILLIQCKNWKEDAVTHKEAKEFLGNCTSYTTPIKDEKRPIKFRLAVSHKVNANADKWIREQQKQGINIAYRVIESQEEQAQS